MFEMAALLTTFGVFRCLGRSITWHLVTSVCLKSQRPKNILDFCEFDLPEEEICKTVEFFFCLFTNQKWKVRNRLKPGAAIRDEARLKSHVQIIMSVACVAPLCAMVSVWPPLHQNDRARPLRACQACACARHPHAAADAPVCDPEASGRPPTLR